jgi:mRNA interferase MazF
MGAFVRGDVVVVPFPFSDLSSSKRRPALVLADLPGDDIILCQITSQFSKDTSAILLTMADFISGSLKTDSFIRPNRLFTADKNIIAYKTGVISVKKQQEVFIELMNLLQP